MEGGDVEEGLEQAVTDSSSKRNNAGQFGKSAVTAVEEVRKLPLHPSLVGVGAQLEMKPLWDEFHDLGTEMIVTKAGR